jgi:hypothetical protein
MTVAGHPRLRLRVVDVRRAGHELEAPLGNGIGQCIDVACANGDVLDALALVFAPILLDLTLVVGAFVDGDSDLASTEYTGADKSHDLCRVRYTCSHRAPQRTVANEENPGVAAINLTPGRSEMSRYVGWELNQPIDHILIPLNSAFQIEMRCLSR